jgi:hypothetical protein
MDMQLKRSVFLLVPAFAIVYLAVSLVFANEPKSGAAKPFKPVQNMDRQMEGQKKVFSQIKDCIAEKSWKDGERYAWILAELANVNHYQRDNAEYQAFADQMSAQCIELAKNLKQRDEKAAKESYNQVGQTCGACHKKFQEKKRRPRGGEGARSEKGG